MMQRCLSPTYFIVVVVVAALLPFALADVAQAAHLFVGSDHGLSAYDLEVDSSTTVWTDPSAGLVDVGYDPQQDDVYYNIFQSSSYVRRFYRDVEPAQYHGPGGSDTTLIKDVSGGVQLDITFDAIDITPSPYMAYQFRDPRSYSDFFVRYTGVAVRDVTTGAETILYSVGRYVAPGQQGHAIEDVAIDPTGTYAYFTDRLDGTIKRVPLDASSGAQIVLSGLNQPNRLAVYGDKFYWTESGVNQIRSSPLLSPVASTLLTTTATPTDIAVGGSRLYWTTASDPVMQANLDGTGSAALGGNAPNGTLLEFGGPTIVPEPSAYVLAGTGLLLLALFGWRRRRAC